jgi:hypothetical protein
MKYYHPVELNNLSVIQKKVFKLVPLHNLNKTTLFYLPNNLEIFFNIPELKEELDKLDRIKSTKTEPKTKKFNVEEGKAELARLREEWSKTPTQDFERRNQLKQQGKTLADRIKKMEGK